MATSNAYQTFRLDGMSSLPYVLIERWNDFRKRNCRLRDGHKRNTRCINVLEKLINEEPVFFIDEFAQAMRLIRLIQFVYSNPTYSHICDSFRSYHAKEPPT